MLIESHAVANNGELTEEQKQSFWQRLNFTKTDTQLSLKDIDKPIISYDVSNNHELLIGFENNCIAITDTEYNIVNFYEFDCEVPYYVFWSDGNIGLMLGRSKVVTVINLNGDLIEIYPRTDIHNDIFDSWHAFSSNHKLIVDRKTYVAKNNIGLISWFLGNYSQLTVEDENRNVVVLVDSGLQFPIKVFCFVLLCLIICACFILKARRAERRQADNNQGTVL
jgi:hypothetical protein